MEGEEIREKSEQMLEGLGVTVVVWDRMQTSFKSKRKAACIVLPAKYVAMFTYQKVVFQLIKYFFSILRVIPFKDFTFEFFCYSTCKFELFS